MDGQDVLPLSWMAKESSHYHGWSRNIVIILRGQGISLLSPPSTINIILVMGDQKVDYYHGWVQSTLLIFIIVITLESHKVFLVWMATSTMMVMDGQWLVSL